MKWIEVELFTANEAIEAVCAVLLEADILGVQIEDDEDMKNFLNSDTGQWDYIDEELLNKENGETKIKFYVSDNEHGVESLALVNSGLENLRQMDLGIDLGRLFLTLTNVDDEGWLNNWKKYYKPFPVGKRVVIRPEWEEYVNSENKIVFTINPGHVFGTGLHQTTQLCIEQLENYVVPETNLLDLGCGSGILSIIAMLLGAKNALAIDIDPNAVNIAYDNAKLNGVVDDYKVLSGNVLENAGLQAEIGLEKYDVVVANIVADIIIAMSGFVAQAIVKDGIFISSGIISERVAEVLDALKQNGFNIVSENSKDDWVCIVAKKA